MVGEIISTLSKHALEVLQIIEDLQFTGRPYTKPRYGDGRLVYFDPVPFVALYGELSPVTFDIYLQLRLLKTEEAVTHSVHHEARRANYIRPDGKVVAIYALLSEDEDYQYVATVDNHRVYAKNIFIAHGDTDPKLMDRYRIDCYQITRVGRALLATNNAKELVTQQREAKVNDRQDYEIDIIREHGPTHIYGKSRLVGKRYGISGHIEDASLPTQRAFYPKDDETPAISSDSNGYDEVIRHLKPNHRKVYEVIVKHYPIMLQGIIGHIPGLTESTANRAIKVLKEKGFIHNKPGYGYCPLQTRLVNDLSKMTND